MRMDTRLKTKSVINSKYDSCSDLDEYSQEEDDCGGFSDGCDRYLFYFKSLE